MSSSMRCFSEVIEELELSDMALQGALLLRGELARIVQCPKLIVF